MGILSSILGNRSATTTTTTPSGDYLPANRTGYAMLDRATEFYRQNPKKVQMVGLIAAAALLSRMGSRR
jgi:hypothetical protein